MALILAPRSRQEFLLFRDGACNSCIPTNDDAQQQAEMAAFGKVCRWQRIRKGRRSFSPEAACMRSLLPALLSTALAFAGCAGESGTAASTPTGPTVAAVNSPSLSLASIASVPDGAGVQYNTDFQLTATGTFPAGTEFVWTFGDGSSTTTSTPTVGRVYGQAGVFPVTVNARRGAESASATRQVSVRSMLGRWFGTITGFTSFPLQRPVAMTSFELLVANQTPDGSTLMLHGRWADDAGCRETRVEFLRQRIEPAPTATVTFGVNGLSCASGDFYLTGEADAAFDHVTGNCNVAGNNPNCRFTMRRE
jgi:hypothetical protein